MTRDGIEMVASSSVAISSVAEPVDWQREARAYMKQPLFLRAQSCRLQYRLIRQICLSCAVDSDLVEKICCRMSWL